MKRNSKVKSASKKKKSAGPARKANQRSRAPEITGIAALGVAIFLFLGLVSLQAGDGRLMGPFGRSFAVLLYSGFGICGYAVAAGLGWVAVRVLIGREPIAQPPVVVGIGLGLLSLGTLIHLIGSDYLVAGHPPGGALGEGFAEVTRAAVSTAGTVLLALVGMLVAVVIATPLRFGQVLEFVGGIGRRLGLGLWSGARKASSDVAGFTGDVVRAVLPERDEEEYDEDVDDDLFEDDTGETLLAEAAQDEPPIVDRSGRLAVPEEPTFRDTEKMDDDVVPALVAEDGQAIGTGKKSRRKKKNTELGLGAQKAPGKHDDTAGADDEAAELAAGAPDDDEAVATPAGESDKAGPVIVESQFRHPKADEMKKKEEQVDANRLGFIPLTDGDFQLPPVNMLDYDEDQAVSMDRGAMLEMSAKLTQTLQNYGIKGEVAAIRPGPVVTMYEFAPAPGTRVNKIANLADDLAMSLEALKVRIVAPIPGKAVVGIEVPNKSRETVYLKEILADDSFQKTKAKLPMALGKDIEGAPVVVDMAKMPHLLVAGATGAGKSVAVNTMISSLLYSCTPEDVRLIMVDPKVLELSIYEGIPHLLLPVVTDPKKANLALRWAVDEMERRYDLLARMGVRDIASYNKKLAKLEAKYQADKLRAEADRAELAASAEGEDDPEQQEMVFDGEEQEAPPTKLPFIVVVIDEFADLMMCAPKEVETSVARIAQKARAAGIHLLLATQRPSVDVITGLIKANFPSRIAFHVTSKVDSRTILDRMGAENLLGAGDMLFSDRGSEPRRLHGCFVQEEEIGRVVEFLKEQGRPAYNMDILKPRDEDGDSSGDGDGGEGGDDLYDRAVRIVAETQRVSVSYLQRRLSVGYNRAAKMVERMEQEGVVSPPDVKKVREVLISAV